MEVFKEVALTGVLPSLARMRRSGRGGDMICTVKEAAKGMQYRLAWQELLSC
jgi:hypothetical protein